jgi:hypothetical protein
MSDRRPLSISYLLALATVALAPNQYLGTITRAGLRLTPADIMLALALAAFAIESWRARRRVTWPPAVLWALVAAAGAAMLACSGPVMARAGSLRPAVRETAQMIEWFLVAYLVFRNAFDSPARVRTAAWVLAGATAAVVVYAGVQAITRHDPMAVAASFGTQAEEFHPSRHAYAAYLALALPVILGLIGPAGRARRGGGAGRLALSLGLVVIIALGLATVSPLGLMIAVFVGLLTVVAASGGRAPTIMAALIAIVIGAVPLRVAQVRNGNLGTSGNFSRPAGVENVERERQAALKTLELNFPTGVGLGGYLSQIRVNYFGPQLEWDSETGYLVLGSTGGWLSLAMLLAAVAYFGGLAIRAARSWRAGDECFRLAAGLTGALAGLVVAQIFSSLLVRGTGLVIGLIFALIASVASEEGEDVADITVVPQS